MTAQPPIESAQLQSAHLVSMILEWHSPRCVVPGAALDRPDDYFARRDIIEHRHSHTQMLIHQQVRRVRHPLR